MTVYDSTRPGWLAFGGWVTLCDVVWLYEVNECDACGTCVQTVKKGDRTTIHFWWSEIFGWLCVWIKYTTLVSAPNSSSNSNDECGEIITNTCRPFIIGPLSVRPSLNFRLSPPSGSLAIASEFSSRFFMHAKSIHQNHSILRIPQQHNKNVHPFPLSPARSSSRAIRMPLKHPFYERK